MKTNTGKFNKGHKPWNKGLKGIHLSPKTEFKSGKLENHPSFKGGIQRMSTGEVYVAIAPNKRVRQARLVWEQHNGKIPHGFVIYHLDKNPGNNDIENLEAISRAELAIKNKNESKNN